ncbi:MAG TPA: hypothetical protein VJ998_00020 [Pseudomonadales bacterium]|nr:hypothetical protein [Pseudomonadales bacterium]
MLLAIGRPTVKRGWHVGAARIGGHLQVRMREEVGLIVQDRVQHNAGVGVDGSVDEMTRISAVF